MPNNNSRQDFLRMIDFLRKKRSVLFLTTSTRWAGEKTGERPKSTLLARKIAEKVGEKKVRVIDVPRLKIYPCEGNVSTERGNTCGVQKALLKDPDKNPTGHHRCWASVNNKDDELWQISKALFESDCLVFFGSVRWGQMNAEYQKLIERLTWVENRHSTLGGDNVLGTIDAGVVVIGQNWRGREVLETQKQVLQFFGFQVRDELSWNWQFTENFEDEDDQSYQKATEEFYRIFLKE